MLFFDDFFKITKTQKNKKTTENNEKVIKNNENTDKIIENNENLEQKVENDNIKNCLKNEGNNE